jgi:hypothetical protein
MIKKSYFLHTFILQLVFSTSLFAHHKLKDFDLSEHSKSYSRLPKVEDNAERFDTHPERENLVKQIGEILRGKGLDNILGIRLIHRHHPLSQGHVMVETPREESGIPTLVTSPRPFEVALEIGAQPASWIFGTQPGDIFLFETSNDLSVRAATEVLKTKPEVFEAVGSILRQFNATSLLSLAIISRSTLQAREGEFYMERSTKG